MKLICGIDATRDAPFVAGFAMRLSDDLGADLTLAHFIPAESVGGDLIRDALMCAVADRVGETLARGRGDSEGVLGMGDPADQLLSLAEKESAAMIVVGSRGRGAAKAAALGSVARRVVAGSRCPVTVVPGDTGFSTDDEGGDADIETIVAGYDGSPESVVALRSAAAYARPLKAALVVVEVTDPPAVGYVPGMGVVPLAEKAVEDESVDGRVQRIQEELPSGVTAQIETLEGFPAQGIAEVAERVGAGLIVVGSRGRGPFGEMMLGSTSSALAYRGTRPVMICTREVRPPVPIS